MHDLISRQVVIDAFYKYPNIDWTTLDVLAKIKALPSASDQVADYCDRLWKIAYQRGRNERPTQSNTPNALDGVPKTSINDLIGRRGAIEEAINAAWMAGDHSIEMRDALRDALMLLPSAERRGKWVPYEFGNELWHKCTACGVADKYIDEVRRADGRLAKVVGRRRYCPNCGAKMEGADDE